MSTEPKTTSKAIPNKVTARAVHKRMRAEGASHYALGCFYKDMLTRRLWSSQSDLARSLEISKSNISKAIALTRIPMEVVEAVGGAKHVSFRIGELLLSAIDKFGAAMFISRVREAVRAGFVALDDILEFAVFDRLPRPTPRAVRVRLARDKKSLRLDIPDLDQLLPHLSDLEEFIVRNFIFFKIGLSDRQNAAAESAQRRLRMAASRAKVGPPNIKPRREAQGGSADTEI
ncbi:MAG TPA: hypothetical protein VJU59_43030 [Paraburkholderia sp.]|uniref:hypothetical protein n=1 Tax=Paraburkholderia sp. TaxID=1926495 RepID=UPI002B4A44B6|nr:hypothetical protein [Paraburkholderia sp.]HKR46366.1 hypothetical protein [Paraburkholderia sp.]